VILVSVIYDGDVSLAKLSIKVATPAFARLFYYLFINPSVL